MHHVFPVVASQDSLIQSLQVWIGTGAATLTETEQLSVLKI
jgi:hypothetical protein